MGDVAVCPRCHGEKLVGGKPCRTCDGTGVKWRVEEASEPAADDPRDLTYRP